MVEAGVPPPPWNNCLSVAVTVGVARDQVLNCIADLLADGLSLVGRCMSGILDVFFCAVSGIACLIVDLEAVVVTIVGVCHGDPFRLWSPMITHYLTSSTEARATN